MCEKLCSTLTYWRVLTKIIKRKETMCYPRGIVNKRYTRYILIGLSQKTEEVITV